MDGPDARIVERQLGRPPRGAAAVAARCPHGLPLVIRTDPLLPGGEPFPTLYWLTCPAAVKFAGRLEAEGLMRELNARLGAEPDFARRYREAHEAYLAERDAIAALPGGVSAGGMPERVKCLHALYAHEAAVGANPVGAIVRERIEPIDCPGPCVADDGEHATVTPGHPHLR